MKYIHGIIIKIYNWTISRESLNKNNSLSRKIRNMLMHNICYSCEARFGKLNKNRKFYVIRCPQETMGLFGVYNYVVKHLKIAENLGAEPVIDWQYYPNSSILNDSQIGKLNAWEFFFKQPSSASLQEVYHSNYVIMSNGEGMSDLAEVDDSKELEESRRIIQKYIKLNQEMLHFIEDKYIQLDMKDKKILGVLCRGTDFTASKPKGHAICPTAEETIQTIHEKENEWGNFDKIFLATEDEEIFQRIKEEFGERLIYCQNERISNAKGKWLNQLFEEESYWRTKEIIAKQYLGAIYLLARCDALIAPIVGGTLGAMRIKGKYDKIHLFQLGIYI